MQSGDTGGLMLESQGLHGLTVPACLSVAEEGEDGNNAERERDQLRILRDIILDPEGDGLWFCLGMVALEWFALVALVDDLRRGMDRGSASLLVLLDLSAAFDTIDNGVLLGRLGIGGTVLQWFHSFLADRSQKVVLGDACSAPRSLRFGVPQGSILSPMLFNIYMKLLGEVIRGFGVKCHQYADDTQLYISFPPDSKETVEVLNRCLEAVGGWMRANKLRLNPDKAEVLLVRKSTDS